MCDDKYLIARFQIDDDQDFHSIEESKIASVKLSNLNMAYIYVYYSKLNDNL